MSGFALCSRRHCAVIEIRSMVLARDDESRAVYYILWVCTIFRQKNIRTKDSFKGRMYIQASLVFICLLNVCTCGDCLRLFCLEKNKRG